MRLIRSQKNYLYGAATLLIILGGYLYFTYKEKKFASITSFKACVDAGYEILATYPEECRIPGKRFTNPTQITSITTKVATTSQKIDPQNATYLVEGQLVTLIQGKGQLPPPQGSQRASTSLSLTNIKIDLDINDDTISDAVFLLKNSSENTPNTNFYITAVVSLYNGSTGINGIYVEDNIQAALLGYKNKEVTLEYTTKASPLKKYKYYYFENDILKERINSSP